MGGLHNPQPARQEPLKRKSLLENNGAMQQSTGAVSDMYKEYKLMKSHNYTKVDDYYHCKANYNAAKRGKYGEATARVLGNLKEGFDYQWNQHYKGLSKNAAIEDMNNDLTVNAEGIRRAKLNSGLSAQDACADYREQNKSLPKKYW